MTVDFALEKITFDFDPREFANTDDVAMEFRDIVPGHMNFDSSTHVGMGQHRQFFTF